MSDVYQAGITMTIKSLFLFLLITVSWSYFSQSARQPKKPFAVRDEWYYHMRFTQDTKNIIPILQVLPPDSTLTRPEGTHTNNPYVREAVLKNKEPQTIAWAYERPSGGRAFGFTGGHAHANWKNDSFRMLVLNAIAWTAHFKIPQNGIITQTPLPLELDKLTKPGR